MTNSIAEAIERFLDRLLWSVQQSGHAYGVTCLELANLKYWAELPQDIETVEFIESALDLIPTMHDPVGQVSILRTAVLTTYARAGQFGEAIEL